MPRRYLLAGLALWAFAVWLTVAHVEVYNGLFLLALISLAAGTTVLWIGSSDAHRPTRR